MTRDFKGIWIPKEIWLDNSLPIIEKIFLVEIDSLDNENGCFASNKYFSEFFGLSKGRCTQIIKSLEEKGFVKITLKRQGKEVIKRIIKVVNKLNRVDSKLNTPSENIKYPYLENDEDNNTSINNINTNNTDYKIKEFEKFYKLYPRHLGNIRFAREKFMDLDNEEIKSIFDHLPKFIKETEKKYIPFSQNYLERKVWGNIDKELIEEKVTHFKIPD